MIGVEIEIKVGFMMGWYRIERRMIEKWVKLLRMIKKMEVIKMEIVKMGIDE